MANECPPLTAPDAASAPPAIAEGAPVVQATPPTAAEAKAEEKPAEPAAEKGFE